MKRLLPLAVVVLFGLIGMGNSMDAGLPRAMLPEHARQMILNSVGSAAAVLGLLGILYEWWSETTVVAKMASQMVPSAIVLFAGILILSQSWGAAPALAAILAAAMFLRGKQVEEAGPQIPD